MNSESGSQSGAQQQQKSLMKWISKGKKLNELTANCLLAISTISLNTARSVSFIEDRTRISCSSQKSASIECTCQLTNSYRCKCGFRWNL